MGYSAEGNDLTVIGGFVDSVQGVGGEAAKFDDAMGVYKAYLRKWPEEKEKFKALYEICADFSRDKEAFEYIEGILKSV